MNANEALKLSKSSKKKTPQLLMNLELDRIQSIIEQAALNGETSINALTNNLVKPNTTKSLEALGFNVTNTITKDATSENTGIYVSWNT